jgi:hypothetical protein
MSAPIRLVHFDLYTPTTLPREVRYRCRPSCCANPYFCARKRDCACHEGEDK